MSPAALALARAWCADAFTDYPDDATRAEILACLRGQYDGGIAGFLADAAEALAPMSAADLALMAG